MIKKIIAVFLCAVIFALSFSTSVFAVNADKESGTDYPFVFVHGLMGGATDPQGVEE